jgi:SNF2 family DNA or RNA helicase
LTLTAANRIIFLEPCWLPDLEAQAKKRAHRIGQTRPVTVDTLVMAGSFEERMFARRKNLHSEGACAA